MKEIKRLKDTSLMIALLFFLEVFVMRNVYIFCFSFGFGIIGAFAFLLYRTGQIPTFSFLSLSAGFSIILWGVFSFIDSKLHPDRAYRPSEPYGAVVHKTIKKYEEQLDEIVEKYEKELSKIIERFESLYEKYERFFRQLGEVGYSLELIQQIENLTPQEKNFLKKFLSEGYDRIRVVSLKGRPLHLVRLKEWGFIRDVGNDEYEIDHTVFVYLSEHPELLE